MFSNTRMNNNEPKIMNEEVATSSFIPQWNHFRNEFKTPTEIVNKRRLRRKAIDSKVICT